MKTNTKKTAMLALLLVGTLLFSACADSGTGTPTTAKPADTTAPATETTAVPGETTAVPVETTKTEDTTVNEIVVTTDAGTKKTIRVATYNIKHGADVGMDVSILGADITSNNIDIVGFQEIDMETTRIGGKNTMKLLSKVTGYQYWEFTKAIDYGGGGYGTAILSRYPIESIENIMLESGTNEQRAIGHAVINVDGFKIDFFNTHLSYESKEIRTIQFEAVAKLVKNCEHFLLTADFNTSDFNEYKVIGNGSLVNNRSKTFATFTSSATPIDNIVMSTDVFTLEKAAMGPTGHSDHRMLWAELSYID